MSKLQFKVSSLRRAGMMCCGIGAVAACSVSEQTEPGTVDAPNKPVAAPASAPGASKVTVSGLPPTARVRTGVTPTSLIFFDGSVDVFNQTMTVVVRSPSGQIQAEETLPYGTAASEVYFHTCPTPAVTYTPSGAGGTLTGLVQAVNNLSGTVFGMSVVFDSFSDTGTSFSSTPTADGQYGDVPNTGAKDCAANTLTWSFVQATTTNFTFSGHAEWSLTSTCDSSCATCDGPGVGQCLTCPSTDYHIATNGSPTEVFCYTTCPLANDWENTAPGEQCACDTENGCDYPPF